MTDRLDYLLLIVHPHAIFDPEESAKEGIQELVYSEHFNKDNSVILLGRHPEFNDEYELVGDTIKETYLDHDFQEIRSGIKKQISDEDKSKWLPRAYRYIIAGGDIKNCGILVHREIIDFNEGYIEFWISGGSIFNYDELVKYRPSESNEKFVGIANLIFNQQRRFIKETRRFMDDKKQEPYFAGYESKNKILKYKFYSSNAKLFEAIKKL